MSSSLRKNLLCLFLGKLALQYKRSTKQFLKLFFFFSFFQIFKKDHVKNLIKFFRKEINLKYFFQKQKFFDTQKTDSFNKKIYFIHKQFPRDYQNFLSKSTPQPFLSLLVNCPITILNSHSPYQFLQDFLISNLF